MSATSGRAQTNHERESVRWLPGEGALSYKEALVAARPKVGG